MAKKDYGYISKGDMVKITLIDDRVVFIHVESDTTQCYIFSLDYMYTLPCIYNVFYTSQELRKIKLKKLATL